MQARIKIFFFGEDFFNFREECFEERKVYEENADKLAAARTRTREIRNALFLRLRFSCGIAL